MSNPFDVLGIPNTASDSEVKDAYRALAKKYHPDNYNNAPDIAEVAAEKMREVNEAYNTIMKSRKNGGSSNAAGSSSNAGSASNSAGGAKSGWGWGGFGGRQNSGSSQSSSSGQSQNTYTQSNSGSAGYSYSADNAGRYSTTSDFGNVRQLIMAGKYDDADEVLSLVAADRRSAEWYFLKGTVLYSRGWLEQSFTYLQTAVNMDPGNYEYRAAYNQAAKMRGGGAGGYKISGREGVGCNLCSSCRLSSCACMVLTCSVASYSCT